MNENFENLTYWLDAAFTGKYLDIMSQSDKYQTVLSAICRFAIEDKVLIHQIMIGEIADNEFLIKINNKHEVNFIPKKGEEVPHV